jgi:hypothetical protein
MYTTPQPTAQARTRSRWYVRVRLTLVCACVCCSKGEELISLETIGNWLVRLPNESEEQLPPHRVSHGTVRHQTAPPFFVFF